MQNYKIASSAIIFKNDKILLVKAKNTLGQIFFVGPGGTIEGHETLHEALTREVREETRLEISPRKMLFVEDLLLTNYRKIKFWFLCEVTGGSLQQYTQEAEEEGILEVGWYSKDELLDNIVYPRILMEIEWQKFVQDNWSTVYLPLTLAKL